jgi:hypothetical protein
MTDLPAPIRRLLESAPSGYLSARANRLRAGLDTGCGLFLSPAFMLHGLNGEASALAEAGNLRSNLGPSPRNATFSTAATVHCVTL